MYFMLLEVTQNTLNLMQLGRSRTFFNHPIIIKLTCKEVLTRGIFCHVRILQHLLEFPLQTPSLDAHRHSTYYSICALDRYNRYSWTWIFGEIAPSSLSLSRRGKGHWAHMPLLKWEGENIASFANILKFL